VLVHAFLVFLLLLLPLPRFLRHERSPSFPGVNRNRVRVCSGAFRLSTTALALLHPGANPWQHIEREREIERETEYVGTCGRSPSQSPEPSDPAVEKPRDQEPANWTVGRGRKRWLSQNPLQSTAPLPDAVRALLVPTAADRAPHLPRSVQVGDCHFRVADFPDARTRIVCPGWRSMGRKEDKGRGEGKRMREEDKGRGEGKRMREEDEDEEEMTRRKRKKTTTTRSRRKGRKTREGRKGEEEKRRGRGRGKERAKVKGREEVDDKGKRREKEGEGEG